MKCIGQQRISYIRLHLYFIFTDGGSNLKCADALYCVSMPKAGSESSAKVLLQNELRGCNPVVDARILTRCGNQQFLVLLEAMKSSSKESNESHG